MNRRGPCSLPRMTAPVLSKLRARLPTRHSRCRRAACRQRNLLRGRYCIEAPGPGGGAAPGRGRTCEERALSVSQDRLRSAGQLAVRGQGTIATRTWGRRRAELPRRWPPVRGRRGLCGRCACAGVPVRQGSVDGSVEQPAHGNPGSHRMRGGGCRRLGCQRQCGTRRRRPAMPRRRTRNGWPKRGRRGVRCGRIPGTCASGSRCRAAGSGALRKPQRHEPRADRETRSSGSLSADLQLPRPSTTESAITVRTPQPPGPFRRDRRSGLSAMAARAAPSTTGYERDACDLGRGHRRCRGWRRRWTYSARWTGPHSAISGWILVTKGGIGRRYAELMSRLR